MFEPIDSTLYLKANNYEDTSGRATRFVSLSSIELWLLFGFILLGVDVFVELGKDVDGFANSTPSYWTPFNSIVTTNCCSPLAELPKTNWFRTWASSYIVTKIYPKSLTTTSYFELHSRQYRRRTWRCIRNTITDRWWCVYWFVRYVMLIRWRSWPFIVHWRWIVSLNRFIDRHYTFRGWLTRNISFSISFVIITR